MSRTVTLRRLEAERSVPEEAGGPFPKVVRRAPRADREAVGGRHTPTLTLRVTG